MGRPRYTLEQRVANFLSRVDNSNGEFACWNWIAGKDKRGYGQFRNDERRVKAHRFSYEYFVGMIPDGLLVLHDCDNPSCVNPTHLWLGTNADNVADRHRKGRDASGDKNASRLYPERRLRGEEHRSAKLTEADVIQSRRLFARGVSVSELSRQFHITRQAMTSVVRHESWKHVTDTAQSLSRLQLLLKKAAREVEAGA